MFVFKVIKQKQVWMKKITPSIFQILWKSSVVSRLLFHPIWSFEKITLYDIEILTLKVELWIFSLISLEKKHHQSTFPVKTSVTKTLICYLPKFGLVKLPWSPSSSINSLPGWVTKGKFPPSISPPLSLGDGNSAIL